MRLPRRESSSSVYHIVSRGAAHQIIFEDDEDRAYFMSRVASAADAAEGEVLAWCLMDNHVHLLIRISFDQLSGFMHAVLSGYAGYFNRVHGRSGPVFDGRYKSEPVESDDYLLTVVRYIHRNPLKAGMATELFLPWTSYREYVGTPRIVHPEFVLGVFGGKDELVAFHEEPFENEEALDIDVPKRKRVSDADASSIAREVLGCSPNLCKALDRQMRNAALVEMKRRGLTARQIQRLTGISLGTISQA